MFDGMQKVGFTCALISKNWNHFRMRIRGVSVLINNPEQLFAFAGIKLGNMINRTNFIIRIAGKIIPEWVTLALEPIDCILMIRFVN